MKKILLSAICLSLAIGCISGAEACHKKAVASETTKGIISVEAQTAQPFKDMNETELNELVNNIGNKMLEKNNIQKKKI